MLNGGLCALPFYAARLLCVLRACWQGCCFGERRRGWVRARFVLCLVWRQLKKKHCGVVFHELPLTELMAISPAAKFCERLLVRAAACAFVHGLGGCALLPGARVQHAGVKREGFRHVMSCIVMHDQLLASYCCFCASPSC